MTWLFIALAALCFILFGNWMGGWSVAVFFSGGIKLSDSYDYFKVNGYELEGETLPVRELVEHSKVLQDRRSWLQKLYSIRLFKPILVYCITDKQHKLIWIELIKSWGLLTYGKRTTRYWEETNSASMALIQKNDSVD